MYLAWYSAKAQAKVTQDLTPQAVVDRSSVLSTTDRPHQGIEREETWTDEIEFFFWEMQLIM